MNQLTKFLVDSILNEGDKSLDTVALFGGGFKPPTKGHLEVVLQGLKENPQVKQIQILVGSGERNGITQEESIKIWEMYKKFIPVSTQIIKVQSPFSYIKTYLQDHQDEDVYIFIGARSGNEEDDKDVAERSKFAKKYSKKAIPTKIQTSSGVSGTMARKAALSGNNKEFLQYFPNQLTNSEKKEIIQIISSVINELDLSDISNQNVSESLGVFRRVVVSGDNFNNFKSNLDSFFSHERFTSNYQNLKYNIIISPVKENTIVIDLNGEGADSVSRKIKDIGEKHKMKVVVKLKKPIKPINENASYSKEIDIQKRIMQLTQHMLDKGYNIEPLPTVEFVDGDSENARDFLGKTAYYNPNNQIIVLYTEGRHPKDIVRSFAHEMIHHIQNLEGRLSNITTTNTQEDNELNKIEAEANLKGTMTFRNWTDSLNEAIVGDKVECNGCGWSWKIADGGDDLFMCHKCGYDNTPINEDGQKISNKNMDDYKKSNNPSGKVKDPFGLNAYAQELARGLEEKLEEGRKKKKDPKKGTGKKPKKSGRRLYTDEDPKDTIGIKFSTRQDIVDTLNKKSFKAKSHARQSQIINLIHQRVRAAYGRAKDPAVKKRLKTALDYAEQRKEASKAKTQRLKKQKTNENLGAESKPKMSFEERLAYYKDYYINVSPSTFDIITENGTIVIEGLDKPYPKDFNDVDDTRQVPVNENVPDVKDDGKAAPYGSGYKKLNEGRYDTLANQLSKIAFESFKDIHDRGDKEGEFSFRVDHPEDEHDIPSKEFYFDFIGTVTITDDEYQVDGGANAGFDNKGEEITPMLSINFKIPKNPDWQRVSFDIKDVVRHELEHLTQDGDNVKPGKQREDDQLLRDLIDADLLPKSQYFKLEKEVDAMLQGLYFKAKKSKRPFKDVIDEYLNIFLDQLTITQEEKNDILDIWRSRGKSLSLPVFENKGKVMNEENEKNYTIYCDMDGVLVDFDKRFTELAGMGPREYESTFGKEKFWDFIDSKEKGGGVGFWVGMDWMPGGEALYNRVAQHDHALLSSPSRSESSRIGKHQWKKKYTPSTKLILALAKNKQNYADGNNILIDDRESNIRQWREAGGIGILYKSASQVNKELDKLGL